jgi:hypothetical protein
MKYLIFVLCGLLIYFVIGGKDYNKEAKYYPPHGLIVAVKRQQSLVIRKASGTKVIADVVSGASGWEVGDAVEVVEMAPGGSYIRDLDTGKRASVLIGQY